MRLYYRPSRVSGNPGLYCLMMVLSIGNRWIPAYAGMTVGGWGMTVKEFPGKCPPYRRLRRTVFLQVALQVRLCRAWWL